MSFLWLIGILTIVVSVSGHWKGWSAPGRNLKDVNCRKVKEANLCQSCCKDPCEDVLCLNEGKCKNGKCECTCGYSGPYCKVDLCENVTCLNGGQCVSGICKCTPGYDGDNCSVNVCEIKDCLPETRLCVPIRAPGGYTCSCIKRTTFLTPTVSFCQARTLIIPRKRYDNKLNETTIIPGVPGKNLTISFLGDFEIEGNPLTGPCPSDYLEVANTRYCGIRVPADIMLPTGDGTQVRFVTFLLAGAADYTFTYQYIDVLPDANRCKNGGTLTAQQTCNCLSGFQGTNCEFPPIITSGGNYEFGQNFTFTLPGFPDKELVLTFVDDFSIETTDGNCSDILRNTCLKDYVEIEGTRYCGNVAPKPITIPTGSGTTVRFKNDQPVQCPTGFRLNYVYREPKSFK